MQHKKWPANLRSARDRTFDLLLQALPLDGKIVLRTYKEDEEEEQKPKGKPQYKK